ncbi:MAG: DUF4178 domain-containing protein [Betaproteobacteria bacterium]|nr:DUF4178 domain-containing protein [Betaproteobacteria bacterium]
MAVCEYCRSTLVKDADSVKDIGKMSTVLEDYTPLQLNTSGQWKGQGFELVGRIQLRYESGLWNEWYLLFDDGSDGWLADASGQYMLTRRALTDQAATALQPRFEALHPGSNLGFAKRNWVASDVRTAHCTGGEGELPFTAGAGWTAQVADFRDAGSFLTLDYADGYPPAAYVGELVTLEQLKLQLQRNADDIDRSADRYLGKAMPLACPACGSPIAYRAGIANYVVCGNCHSQIDCTESTAVVLKKQSELKAIKSSLKPGESGRIGGQPWTVLGLMQCTDDDKDEPSTWIEYLLFNEEQGLLWLIEQDDGWDRVKVLDEWPRLSSATVATWHGGNFRKGFEYRSRVLYVAGTFNWRVHVGDSTLLTEFGESGLRLTRETSNTEIVWTRSTRIPRAQVAQWFKDNEALAVARPEAASGKPNAGDLVFCRKAALWYSIALGLLSMPMLEETGSGWLVVGFQILLLWGPLLLMDPKWLLDLAKED